MVKTVYVPKIIGVYHKYEDLVNDPLIPKKRFNGKLYYLMYYQRNKEYAEKDALMARELGFCARVVHREGTKFGTFRYAVYVRRE